MTQKVGCRWLEGKVRDGYRACWWLERIEGQFPILGKVVFHPDDNCWEAWVTAGYTYEAIGSYTDMGQAQQAVEAAAIEQALGR